MMYVKIDGQGNPTEVARTFDQVKTIYLSQNTVLPEVFKDHPENFGYAPVPASTPMPPEVAGKAIIADVPKKNADGSFTRVWKYQDIPKYAEIEDEVLDRQLRAKRKSYLFKFADSISPLRWESWTEEQKQEVRDWYQSVLDMTNDPTWPRMALPPLPSPIKE